MVQFLAMVRPALTGLVAAAALLLSVGAAGAHTGTPGLQIGPPPLATPAVAPAVDLRAAVSSAATWPALVAACVALAVCASRRRLALALILMTAAVGVDVAFHSVHHLHDSAAAAACVLASSLTHAPALLSDGAVVVVAPAPAADAGTDAVPLCFAVRVSRPDRGRAPPSSAA
jgi:hypothetical protein